jgi:HAE1 family hydrophobic/amphiphilic exporter-1
MPWYLAQRLFDADLAEARCNVALYSLIPDDVTEALNEQNIEAAPGKFGENSHQPFQYVIRYKGACNRQSRVWRYHHQIGRQRAIAAIERYGRVELGRWIILFRRLQTTGMPSVGVAISQTAGSNARDVIDEYEKDIGCRHQKNSRRECKIAYLVDANEFLNASIEKVISTLIEAFILVFIVVFVFLQDFRSTLIPAIAVPVAILGTFFFLNLFGFTINLLTLFALVLAIGIVVDDAIVVVEAVHAKMDQGINRHARHLWMP